MSDMRPTVLVLSLCLLAACGADPGSTETSADPTTTVASSAPTTEAPVSTTVPPATPLIVDTDMAAEGVMSVLYLLAEETYDIRAITVSGTGLVHCDRGVEQVLGLLALVGADHVPVACGPENPLEGHNRFPLDWRMGADDLYGLELPEGGAPSVLSAPELIASAIAESDVPVVVYADGPQTNLASALRLDPSIAANVERVVAMGGAFDAAGNAGPNPDAEWNVWVDPVAAAEVFGVLPVTLVPLDATNQVPLNLFHLAALEKSVASPAGRAVVTMLDGNEQLAFGGLFFWDQLAAALLVDPTYATVEHRTVEVVLDDDRRVAGVTRTAAGGSPMEVAVDVDTARFETEFLSVIAGADVGPIVMDADWLVAFDGDAWSVAIPAELPSGRFIVELANDGGGDVVAVFGWLTGGATLQDAEAWESIDQPPFYEFEDAAFAAAGTRTFAFVDLPEPRDYVFYGLDFAASRATMLAAVEVAG